MVSPAPVRFNPKNLVAKKATRGVGYDGPSTPSDTVAENPNEQNGAAAGEAVNAGLAKAGSGKAGSGKVEKGKEVFVATLPLNRFKRLLPLLVAMPKKVERSDDHQGLEKRQGEADANSTVEDKAITDEESVVADSYGEVQFDVQFVLKRWGRNVMAVGEFETAFGLQCQRCLGNFRYPVQARFELVLVPDEEAAEKLPESEDPVILDEDGMIHLVDLFEDEIILQIPTVPKHENADDCRFDSPVALIDESVDEPGEGHQQSERRRKDNPFDALKNLKFDQ